MIRYAWWRRLQRFFGARTFVIKYSDSADGYAIMKGRGTDVAKSFDESGWIEEK
jgi:hypothetical protein